MSTLFKFIFLGFILTTYAVINPTITCYNDCEITLDPKITQEPLVKAVSSQVTPLQTNEGLSLDSAPQQNLYSNHQQTESTDSSLSKYKLQTEVVEGGIEGTGKMGGARQLFEFNDEPTPQQEIQKHGEEEDGIEGTGRMALGNEHLIAYGPISRFGSIYVNGLRYQIDQAQVEFVREQQTTELAVGMMVKVKANWAPQSEGTFSAQKVWFDQQVKGPVNDISHTSVGAELNILGLTVHLDQETVLDGLLLKSIKVGNVLAISGIPDTDGSLLATHVTRRSNSLSAKQPVEIEASVISLDANQQRITVKGLVINTRDAKWSNSSIDTVQAGDVIEVLGTYQANSQRLKASTITVKNPRFALQSGNKFSIDAMISAFQSSRHFYLNGQLSDASKAQFLTGSASALDNRVRVKANGKINEDGVFIIRTLEIIQPTNATIKGTVNSVNAANGEITLLGVTAHTKSGTLFQSKLSNANKFFSINDLSSGDWVELKGKWSENKFTLNTVNAINAQDKKVLKGQIEKSDNGAIRILGINIITNALLSDSQIKSLNSGDFLLAKGQMLDADTFNASSIILD